MNQDLKGALKLMITHRIVGEKHIAEEKFLLPRIKHLNKNQRKEFESEYESLIKTGRIFRCKKRTGKGTDFHISINPEKYDEIRKLVYE